MFCGILATTIHQGQSRVTIMCSGGKKIGNEFLSLVAPALRFRRATRFKELQRGSDVTTARSFDALGPFATGGNVCDNSAKDPPKR